MRSGRFDGARDAFVRVLELSAAVDSEHGGDLGGNVLNAYAGPHHLASLLIAAHDGLSEAALTTLPPPDGADPEFWERWLRFRASGFAFVWPNHRHAIANEFHQTGKSAVVVLPTGAGKTKRNPDHLNHWSTCPLWASSNGSECSPISQLAYSHGD